MLSCVIVRVHVGETVSSRLLGLRASWQIWHYHRRCDLSGSDDEDSSEETIYPTVFLGWDKSVAKDEYDLSTSKELDGFFFFLLFQYVPPILPHIYFVIIGCCSHQLFLQKSLFYNWKNLMRPILTEGISLPSLLKINFLVSCLFERVHSSWYSKKKSLYFFFCYFFSFFGKQC